MSECVLAGSKIDGKTKIQYDAALAQKSSFQRGYELGRYHANDNALFASEHGYSTIDELKAYLVEQREVYREAADCPECGSPVKNGQCTNKAKH